MRDQITVITKLCKAIKPIANREVAQLMTVGRNCGCTTLRPFGVPLLKSLGGKIEFVSESSALAVGRTAVAFSDMLHGHPEVTAGTTVNPLLDFSWKKPRGVTARVRPPEMRMLSDLVNLAE